MDDLLDDLLFAYGPDLEREYSPSSVAADFAESVARYRSLSDEALRSFSWQHMAYGPGVDEVVVLAGDIRSARHVHLFIHGGYWQELSWKDALFPARGFTSEGITYGAINYSLAPLVTLDQILDQCCRAILAVTRATQQAGLKARISLSGSSAGAHLAAMMALSDWSSVGLAVNPVSALILMSGIYALRPLTHTSINAALGLRISDADRLSPLLLPARATCPTLIAWGQFETAAFKSQSKLFATHWETSGNYITALEISGKSHFDIVFDLSDEGTELGRHTFQLLREDYKQS
ncbi:alpha/beta hydrolase [Flavisphingomonas formosensis]|uniref:alpha/beta hydrolase n=1 Tax=Flavisphingomonas formosensis TaxID=861534 RepID=UPI0012FABD3F|nr:alpha/beta hydrolase [Sphingomonas formosensis]